MDARAKRGHDDRDSGRLKLQRARLLHLRERAHRREHGPRQFAVDLNQRDGIAARRVAADMKGGNVGFLGVPVSPPSHLPKF